jgi:glycosyltransferase involved in cell wall biosynthesis/protein-L-isoaspartate O-methyltransferase
MIVGVVSSNGNFTGPILAELDRRGHDVRVFQYTEDTAQDMYQLGQLKTVAERVFVDFAQTPLEVVLAEFTCPIVVRLHRLEAYNRAYLESLPWDKVARLFFVAPHVQQMVQQYTLRPPKSQAVVHVGVDTGFWCPGEEGTRKWEPPYTVLMAGNVVPKKRVYTAVQMMHDLGPDYHFECWGNGNMDQGYGNPEYHLNVSDLLSELGMEKRFRGGGNQSPEFLRERMQQAHFVLSASNEEGCHTTVAEAMACGCVPLLNCWKGVREVYPAEWVWRSPGEFVGLVDNWTDMAHERKANLSAAMRQWVADRYEASVMAARVVDAITGPLDAASVGEWYSTHMLEHMVAQDGNARQQAALERVRKHLPEDRPARVLELGCGTAYLSRTLAEEGHDCAGMDLAGGLLEFASDHNPGGADLYQADATAQLARGPWDVVTCIDMLEHVPEKQHTALLARIAMELAPGGVALFNFPHKAGDTQIVEEHVFPKVLRKKLEQVGLEVTEFGEALDVYFEVTARKPGGGEQ